MATYIGKVKVDGTNELPIASTLYGTCSTAAATAAKVVTCANFDKLITGVTIHVKMTYSNTVANPTLNVNSTGAKSIKRYGTTAPSKSAASSWNAGAVISFTYDGTYWQMNDWLVDGNTDTFDKVRCYDAIKAVSAITSGNIIVGDESGYFNLTSGSVFDITYPILYANSDIAASGTGANNYFCISFAVSNMQSLTLTAYKAVFIKGTLSGTDFKPVSTAPLTQTVPTTADHYQYLLLGIANSSTMMYLTFEHPIFEYTGRAFRKIGSLSNYPWETNTAYIGWNKEIHSSLTSGTLTYNIPTPQSSITNGAQEIRCIADLRAVSGLAINVKAPTGYVLTDGDVTTSGGGTLSYTGLNASIYEISIVLLDGSTLGLIMKEWPA